MLRRSFVIAIALVVVSAVASAAPPPSTYYRSIGSAPDYTTGTVTAINSETHIIGSLNVQWKSANRGRGDKIHIAGADYTILSVDAENELTLTAPYTGPTTYAEPYTISRKFQKLVDWEDCIEAAALPCPGVTTASLPTDERIEVGVVYKDTPFLMNTGGERLRLDAVATSAAYHITLTTNPANRHHGIENTGVILDNTDRSNPAIEIRTTHVTIEWIEIQHGDSADQIYYSPVAPVDQLRVRNVIFHDDDNSANGFHVDVNEANVLFYNNVLYGLDHGVHIDNLQFSSPGWQEYYHNTVFGSTVGFNSTKLTIENNVIVLSANIAHSNGTDFNVAQPNGTSANNISGDITALTHGIGTPTVPLANLMFVSPASPHDFHIRRGSVAEDASVPVGVAEDLDGRLRGGLPDVGADETPSSSANPVKALTAKAAYETVMLEWQHPDYGPMTKVDIVRSTISDPLKPSDGILACSWPTPGPFTKGQCLDTQPLTNGTPYYYSAFVYDTGGNYSKERSVTGVPFDTGGGPPAWTYQTRGLTLEPAGVRGATAFAVSNDFFFHAMQGNPGATGGEWPLTGWAPYKLPAAVQHRPVIVNVNGNNTAILGAQDGRVYAVDILTGKLVWKSPVLGLSIDAAPAALVGAYGATGGGADKVYVGTSDPTANALYILDLLTGALVDQFNDFGQSTNIGAITGVAVKYPSGPVFFTSDNGTGATNRNVWSVDVNPLPSPPGLNWSDNPGPIDAGPTLYKAMLFVGSRSGNLLGYNDVGFAPVFTLPMGDGAVKAPIFPVWPHDTLIFSTNTKVHSVQFAATGGCGTPPCTNWGQTISAGASPALFIPGTSHVYAGNGGGTLFEMGINLLTPALSPTIRSWPISLGSGLGGPAFSVSQGMMYVSDTTGRVHGIPWPIP